MSLDVKIREYRPSDAAGIAQLFNESEEGWPGGFTGGVEITEDYVRDWIARSKYVAILLAETGEGKIVGYLSMSEHWLGKDACYVALLNVHPRYRGRGIGTRLLKQAMWKAYQLGYNRVDLHTWAGNTRALRLYKKLGFKWVPGTNVYMQNYLPGLLKLKPIAELVARDNELLFAFKKNLEPIEDDEKLGDREVFIYEWSLDGEKISAVIDRKAWRLCKLECSKYDVELAVDEDKPVRGLPFTAILRIRNKWSGDLRYAARLVAAEDSEIISSQLASGTLKPGEEATAKIRLRVRTGVKDRLRDEPCRSLKIAVEISGERLELAAGFKDTAPIVLERAVPRAFPAGYSGSIKLGLRNRSKKKLKIKFNAEVEPKVLELEPQGAGLAELKLSNLEEEGVTISLPYSVKTDEKNVNGYAVTAAVPVLAPGKVTYAVNEERDRILLAAPDYLAQVRLRGGRVYLETWDGEELAFLGTDEIGPPFWPNELERKTFRYRIVKKDNAVTVELTAVVDKLGGAELKKTIIFRPGPPHVEVRYTLKNSGNAELAAEIAVNGWAPNWSLRKIYIPSAKGLLEVDFLPGETFASRADGPQEPHEIREGWTLHLAAKPLAYMWPLEGLSKLDYSWGRLPRLQYKIRVPPKAEAKLGPTMLLINPGSWAEVRNKYLAWYEGKSPAEVEELDKIMALEVKAEPELPLVECGEEHEIKIRVAKHRRKKLRGRLAFGTARVKPRLIEVNLEDKNAEEYAVKVFALERGVYVIPYVFTSNYGVKRNALVVAAIKSKGKISVEISGEEALVDNGYLQFKASASYAAAIHSMRIGETENAYTAYPEKGILEWYNPWFGGVRPRLSVGTDNLWREKWSIAEASLGEWRGIALETTVIHEKNEKYRQLKITQKYLTIPGSNVIMLHATLENTGRGLLRPYYALTAFLKPGGKLAEKFLVPRHGYVAEWRYLKDFIEEPFAVTRGEYAAIKGKWSAVLVPSLAHKGETYVGVLTFGPQHGCHLFLEFDAENPLIPGEKANITAYLIITEKEAENYRFLANLKPRPRQK